MTSPDVPSLAQPPRDGEFGIAPGVHDLVSAGVADRLGFKALYMSGYAVAAWRLAMPDAGQAACRDRVERVRQIVEPTSAPRRTDTSAPARHRPGPRQRCDGVAVPGGEEGRRSGSPSFATKIDTKAQ